jgi:hypothetical protein
MTDANFSLIFEGAAVENGEMDVKDLAPSLMALGELIQAANAEINGPAARITIVGNGGNHMHHVTIEDMIVEGSCTAEWAMRAGYRWEAIVVGGDALRKRQIWLDAQAAKYLQGNRIEQTVHRSFRVPNQKIKEIKSS